MYYAIHHTTRFRYDRQISESVMEVRMRPRDDRAQRCLRFDLAVSPRAQVFYYRDHLGNTVHHFDIPRPHAQLALVAHSVVETTATPPPPDAHDPLGPAAWDELDQLAATGDHALELLPSRFTEPTELLGELAHELGCEARRGDPLALLREINTAIYTRFDYDPDSTHVHSPVDDALRARRGVCQDYAHIMLALLREHLRVPCRYVSGYLFHRSDSDDRSASDATHAWVEALLPRLGWVGFDPTNNLLAGERHIRVGLGRDYSDVPPTRGVFKGEAESELKVAVKVELCDAPPPPENIDRVMEAVPPDTVEQHQHRQQQQ